MDFWSIYHKLMRACSSSKPGRKPKPERKPKPGNNFLSKLPDKDKIKEDSEETTKNVDYNFDLEDEVSRFRNDHSIAVKGIDVPPPIRSFHELDSFEVSQQIISNVIACGYNEPTPIQMQAIPAMLSDREILACAPTGSGKTVAFLIPVLSSLKKSSRKGFRALILCPTRELAKQTFRECIRLTENTGLKPHIITKVKQDKFGPNFSTKFDILISTPNRLIYLLKQENQILSLNNVEWLIVDESDKLFETGMRGFREQLAEIYKSCNNSEIKRAMFSATHTPQVAGWCKKNLKNVVSVTVGHRNTTVKNVTQELVYVGNESGKLFEFRNLVRKGIPPPVLIFVESKERAKQLYKELILDGIMVDAIHSDRTQLERDNTVRAFREGKVWVLICTELMSRGIDFKGVKLVVNYDFPPSAISYIHRIGRTGRAGRSGRAVTYFTNEDKFALRSIASVMKESGCDVPDFLLKLKKPNKSKQRRQKKNGKRDPITPPIGFKKRKRKNSSQSSKPTVSEQNSEKYKSKNDEHSPVNKTVSEQSFKKHKRKNSDQSSLNPSVSEQNFEKNTSKNYEHSPTNKTVNEQSFKRHKRKNRNRFSDETVNKRIKKE